MWQQWINGILGLAVLATPFLNLTDDQSRLAFVILGALIAVVGFWGAIAHQMMMGGGKMRHA